MNWKSPRFAFAAVCCLAGLTAAVLLFLSSGQESFLGCPKDGCAQVAASIWGEFLGRPLSLWGVVFWGLMTALVLIVPSWGVTGLMAALGGVFSLGLAWAQYQVGVACLWCTVSAVAAVGLMLAALRPLSPPR